MNYKVRLFKIKSNHNYVRTDTVDGFCLELPQLDQGFVMYGEGLEFGTRLVRTTDVKELAKIGETVLFKTRNSTYTLLIEEEVQQTSSTGGR